MIYDADIRHEGLWTVLATGPSVTKLPASFDPDGPVVVINSSAMYPGRRDYWSCLDPVQKFTQVWSPIPKEERKKLGVVWTRKRHHKSWENLGLDIAPIPDNEEEFRKLYLPGVKRKVGALGLTIFATIGRCIGLGATEVHVYGVDMGEHKHGFGQDPDKRDGNSWNKRWKRERGLFTLAMEEWEQAGVPVIRKTP